MTSPAHSNYILEEGNTAKHAQKVSNSTSNGTCRFTDGIPHGKVALVSFPESGNTWVRGLLEKTTGICTGGYICQYNGESHCTGNMIFSQTNKI